MKELDDLYSIAASDYQCGMSVVNHLGHVTRHCLTLLDRVEYRPLATCDDKAYGVFAGDEGVSRPVCTSLFRRDASEVEAAWQALAGSARPAEHRFEMPSADMNEVLYTAITGFAVCFDLFRRGSRKTPGTYLEIVVGSLIQAVAPTMIRGAHVQLRDPGESVSTDIVFLKPGSRGGLVVPAKITTRERIVQPFAHQRILDAVHGAGRFKSILVCVSEMQRQGGTGANAICVPGTIRLFQRYLAPLEALYYLDPPARYLRSDVTELLPVRTLGDLLTHDLSRWLEPKQV